LAVPILRGHSVLEIARGIKAFLMLDVGLVRGEVPDPEQQPEAQQHELHQAHDRMERQSRELERMRGLLLEKDRQLERTKKQLSSIEKRTRAEASRELSYEELYEARIRATSPDAAIGGRVWRFDTVGRLELEVLKREGLKHTDTLVDLGCGTGRLAVHAIPTLAGGHYVGIDISQAMLDAARKRIEETVPDPPCRVSWVHQTTPDFALENDSADMVCAFSVINHMEHEDAYLYLKEALRIVRPGGRFVFSCLPMHTERAREVFIKSASMDMQTRHRKVRHVVTSKELITDIARLTGWTPVRWYDGDEEEIQLGGSGESHKFHQSILVLEAP
jgi:ubiquinone/menaquinone biosynthesis C-methylase UbiE